MVDVIVVFAYRDTQQQKGGKKGKKDRRKKKDEDDEDETAVMLAELALEYEGKKPPAEPAPVDNKPEKPNEPEKESEPVVTEASNKNKKKKGKKGPNENASDAQPPKAEPARPRTASNVTQVSVATTVDTVDTNDDDGDDGEEAADPSKLSKKQLKKLKQKEKEKKEAEKKAAGKGPNKKMIEKMKEALQKQKEEEERLQREEEEKQRQLEELERQRLEQLRLEQERREKKKLKEKERKERQKKMGTYLNPKQKEEMRRRQEQLKIAQESGLLVVGNKTSTSKRRDRPKKPARQESNASQGDSSGKAEGGGEDDTEPMVDDDVLDDTPEIVEEVVVDDWEEIAIVEKKPKKSKEPPAKVTPPTATTERKRTESTTSQNGETSKPKPVYVDPKSLNVAAKPPENYRSPVICVLGHVDTGKTKLLDYIRKTHVQDNEAGGITQQIGATFVPPTAIDEQCRSVKTKATLEMPGLLIIDTPGHESFTNLRSRGSSLCDIAILVIDIMHGLENQTIESLELLKKRRTPFIVALNKIDRLYEWRSNLRKDVEDLIAGQQPNTKLEFQKRSQEVIVQLAEQSINAQLFYQNPDPKSYVSLVPTSAHTGDGMGNLINLIVQLTQSMLTKRIKYVPDQLDATVLEVKAIPGLGTTIDVVIINGHLKEGDKIVLAGHDGPIVTNIRSLLVPQPLKELRVKTPYEELKVVYGSMGVKIAAHDLDKAVAGLQLYVGHKEAEIERLKELCWAQFGNAMKAIKCSDRGVYVQASTLGSLEALLEFLKDMKIPYSGIRIGPVVKRDVMRASIMLDQSPDYAVILAFDVKIERDAQEYADSVGVKIFSADIIYHLFDKFKAYKEQLYNQRKEANKHLAVFPCKLRILPNCVYNKRDPIVVGVAIEDGVLVPGTPIAIPEKGFDLGRVSSLEHDHKVVEVAKKGQEVCIKIDNCGSDGAKLYGRHFDYNDLLYSKISRESIDVMKEYFRNELEKSDWQLMIQLKKLFQIV